MGQLHQGCGPGSGVHRKSRLGHGPKGHQHKHPAGDGGVDHIAANAAEETFHNDDGKHRSHHRLPKRKIGRQIQGQQQAGYSGAEVVDRLFFFGDPIKQPFAENRRCHTGCHQNRPRAAEKQDPGRRCRQQRKDHIQHNAPGVSLGVDMGRCGNMQFFFHYF